MPQQPERLTMEYFMPKDASFQVFYTHLAESTKLHWHEFYEISYIVAGKGINYWNGRNFPVGPGSAFLLTPADFHNLMATPGHNLELINVIFTEDILDDELRFLLFSEARFLGYDYVPDDGQQAEFEAMWNESIAAQSGKRKMMQNILERILLKHARVCPQSLPVEGESAVPVWPVSIRRALLYIEHHFREDLRLEDVAKQAALAPNYFSGLFKETVGTSFRGYLQELRVRFAKSLFRISDSSVTDICYASGFNNLAHFERVFREKTGMSPSTFRNDRPQNIK